MDTSTTEPGGTLATPAQPTTSSGIKTFFLQKIGIDGMQEVGKKSEKKWHRVKGVQPKKWCSSHKFFYVLFSVTQSFLFGFSWSSDNIARSNKKNTSGSLSVYLRQLYNNVGCLYIHVCLKMLLYLKMEFFTSFDITWYAEVAIYTKFIFSHSIVCYF